MDVNRIEYEIRKLERGLQVLLRQKPTQHNKEERKYAIRSYANRIAVLKKELYNITGRCTPSIPRWPV